MLTETDKTALHRAIEIAGSLNELAKRCGVTQPAVKYWRDDAKRVPAEQVVAISNATFGEVKPHELRPDIFPAPEKRKAS